jgi:hypothetical protein
MCESGLSAVSTISIKIPSAGAEVQKNYAVPSKLII